MGSPLMLLALTNEDGSWMHHVILSIPAFKAFPGAVLTPWKCIGYVGTALFAGRWFVQWHVSRKARRVVMPPLFWYMSVSGSVMLLAYFIFGKNDSVGIYSNLFPAFVSVYNLWLELGHRRKTATPDEAPAK